MELQVYQVNGSETGRTVVLDAGVFGVEPNDHVLWLDVRRTQASRRQGTHKTKERSEVAGSTRKLYRQKGTGMARAGDIKSPLRRSGGTIFGPRPRSYGFKLSKKTRQLARRSALSYKAREEAIRVVDAFAFEAPSTRRLAGMIETMGLADKKVLLLTAKSEAALYRSSCNLAKIHVQEARNASSEELLRAGVLIFEEAALDLLTGTLQGGGAAKAPDADAPAVATAITEETPTAIPADDAEAVAAVAEDASAEAAEAEVAEADEVSLAEEASDEAAVTDPAEEGGAEEADEDDEEANA